MKCGNRCIRSFVSQETGSEEAVFMFAPRVRDRSVKLRSVDGISHYQGDPWYAQVLRPVFKSNIPGSELAADGPMVRTDENPRRAPRTMFLSPPPGTNRSASYSRLTSLVP